MSKPLEPIFPLPGDIDKQRRQVKRLIATATPAIVQAVLVILADHHKQNRLKADFLKGWRQAETELGR
ncbi:MAG: hypothetical protein GXY41_04525 [Phycisphaerae bacterium]|nr:hypothetical protein [Phycisphaerae bacterium]